MRALGRALFGEALSLTWLLGAELMAAGARSGKQRSSLRPQRAYRHGPTTCVGSPRHDAVAASVPTPAGVAAGFPKYKTQLTCPFLVGFHQGGRLLEGPENDGGTIGGCPEFLQKDELETRKMEGRKNK